MVTELITATGPTRPDLDTEEVVDVTYALTSPDLYDLLVRQCGWQPARFEQWLVESLLHLVLGPPRN